MGQNKVTMESNVEAKTSNPAAAIKPTIPNVEPIYISIPKAKTKPNK